MASGRGAYLVDGRSLPGAEGLLRPPGGDRSASVRAWREHPVARRAGRPDDHRGFGDVLRGLGHIDHVGEVFGLLGDVRDVLGILEDIDAAAHPVQHLKRVGDPLERNDVEEDVAARAGPQIPTHGAVDPIPDKGSASAAGPA
jgi:hypothetical protein